MKTKRFATNPACSEIVILDNPLDPDSKLADQFRNDIEPDDLIGAHKIEMMARLLHYLENNATGPGVGAFKMCSELLLTFAADEDRATKIRICVNANDYAPLEDGMPPFHYRVNYTVPDNTKPNPLSVDRRSKSVQDVGGSVLEAIARCR